jgi:uncharacterized protein with HEPN domain
MHEIVKERLLFIINHAMAIEERVEKVKDAQAFVASKEGEILLDSIITRLQALSENVKQIQKLESQFFHANLPYDIKSIVRFRDLASHHYESLNHEVIYRICKVEVPAIRLAVEKYLDNQGLRS